MSITEKGSAFVDPNAGSIALSQMFTVTPGASDPEYLVLTVSTEMNTPRLPMAPPAAFPATVRRSA